MQKKGRRKERRIRGGVQEVQNDEKVKKKGGCRGEEDDKKERRKGVNDGERENRSRKEKKELNKGAGQ